MKIIIIFACCRFLPLCGFGVCATNYSSTDWVAVCLGQDTLVKKILTRSLGAAGPGWLEPLPCRGSSLWCRVVRGCLGPWWPASGGVGSFRFTGTLPLLLWAPHLGPSSLSWWDGRLDVAQMCGLRSAGCWRHFSPGYISVCLWLNCRCITQSIKKLYNDLWYHFFLINQ